MTVKKLSQLLARAACLASMVASKLSIEGPDPLAYVFDSTKGEIKAQYANFGHIPYGQTLVSSNRPFSQLTIFCAF